jgi:F-type H+-transporting ATPase subunit beta
MQMNINADDKKVKVRNGKIISVRGSVVDIWFDDNLPPIYTLVHSSNLTTPTLDVLLLSFVKKYY